MTDSSNQASISTIYLIRHATPDWTRKDIPYNVPPGPPLTPGGEREAQQLAVFLRNNRVERVFTSAMLRARQTAHTVEQTVHIPYEIRPELIEWQPGESEEEVKTRIWPFIQSYSAHKNGKPTAFISHGGPITVLLKSFRMQESLLDHYCHSFDGNNPLPPAGAWQVKTINGEGIYKLDLEFKPDVQ